MVKPALAWAAVILLALLAVCLLTLFRGETSVTGTWSVTEYVVDGERVSTARIGQYYGTDFEDWNKLTLTFTQNGNMTAQCPAWEEAILLSYEMEDDRILVHKPDADRDYSLWRLKNDLLIWNLDGAITLLLKRQ